MKNQASAQIPLDYFGLLLNQAPSSSLSAENWNGQYISLDSSPYRFRWNTVLVDPSLANKVSGDGTLSAPVYAIQPGKSLGGFEISSAQVPGIVQFFAQGFAQIASGTPTLQNDEPVPSCPQWDFENPQIETQVTGATVGPSDPSTVSVRIRAREETGIHPCQPINSKSPAGKIAVLVLSSHTFDPSEIDVTSVIFGPSYAAPISSKLVPTGLGESIGSDERAEWEKALEALLPESSDRKNVHPKNLLLVFDVPALDVQCGLDQSLFLRGKTTAGQQFIGAVPAKVAGCGSNEVGKHKRHPFPFKWWMHQR